MTEYDLRECGYPDCGWLFVASRTSSTYCLDHGGGDNQPRICKVGAETTNWNALVGLAQYMLRNTEDKVASKSFSAIYDAIGDGVER